MAPQVDPTEPTTTPVGERPRTAAAPPSSARGTGTDDRRRGPQAPRVGRTRSSRSSPSSAVALVALVFDKNIGFAAITAAVILTALFPTEQKGAIKQIAWPTVLLVAGVSTFAAILETAGAPESVGMWAAGLGTAVIGALVLCYVGGIISAFASSTALLPIIVPIAIPLIADGGVSAVACRGRAGGILDDRRRQPVLHQRRADARQPAGHHLRGESTTSRS